MHVYCICDETATACMCAAPSPAGSVLSCSLPETRVSRPLLLLRRAAAPPTPTCISPATVSTGPTRYPCMFFFLSLLSGVVARSSLQNSSSSRITMTDDTIMMIMTMVTSDGDDDDDDDDDDYEARPSSLSSVTRATGSLPAAHHSLHHPTAQA